MDSQIWSQLTMTRTISRCTTLIQRRARTTRRACLFTSRRVPKSSTSCSRGTKKYCSHSMSCTKRMPLARQLVPNRISKYSSRPRRTMIVSTRLTFRRTQRAMQTTSSCMRIVNRCSLISMVIWKLIYSTPQVIDKMSSYLDRITLELSLKVKTSQHS